MPPWLKKNGRYPYLVPADVYRPAAIDQLIQLGRELNVPVYHEDPASSSAPRVAKNALDAAKRDNVRWLLMDTGGRLHIDDDMMSEVAAVHERSGALETLFVVDSMAGQDAVNAATAFGEALLGAPLVPPSCLVGDDAVSHAHGLNSGWGSVPMHWFNRDVMRFRRERT